MKIQKPLLGTIFEETVRQLHYINAVSAAAEQRIGKSICAAEVIFFARRLCRLLEVNAPQMIVNNEKNAWSRPWFCTVTVSARPSLGLFPRKRRRTPPYNSPAIRIPSL